MKFRKLHSMLIAAILTCSLAVTPVFAAPASNNQASLQEKKAAAQNEANSLQSQLNTLMGKMNELEGQMVTKGQEISKAKEDLVAAEEKEAQQYEDMKLRIKYMYEEGDGSALERILGSGTIAEVLSQAEYVQKIHSYDRSMLQEYAETVEEVETLKSTLENDMTKLENLEGEYKSQSNELSTMLSSKQAEVENLDVMIQEAAKAALEEQKKKEAAEAEKKKKEQAASAGQNNNSGSTNNGGNTNTTTPDQQQTPDNPPNTDVPENNNNPEPAPAPAPEPNYNASTGNAVVDRAYSWVGNAEYSWGACAPGSFDCSGFVSYCLTGSYSRLGTTFTFLAWPQVSDPQPGDVCVNASHCGIYIGGGQMIHAADYGIGVIVGPVQGGMIYVRY